MADEVRVDPAVLDAGAGTCHEVSGSLVHDLTSVGSPTEQAASGLPGWFTRRVLEDLPHWWCDDSAKLGKYIDKVGTGLESCARDYRHTDHANARCRSSVRPRS
jgi:hypothetical protein